MKNPNSFEEILNNYDITVEQFLKCIPSTIKIRLKDIMKNNDITSMNDVGGYFMWEFAPYGSPPIWRKITHETRLLRYRAQSEKTTPLFYRHDPNVYLKLKKMGRTKFQEEIL